MAPCRLPGSAPHKSGGRRVKSWPDDTLQSFGFAVINKKQISIRCNHTHNTHWVHLKCIYITATIQTRLEIHHSYTHTERSNHTKHRQHNSPSQTNHHPPTHKQQSIKGQKHHHTSNQHKRHQKQKLIHSTQPDIITI